MVNVGTAGLRKALADLPCCWKLAGGLELCCDQWWLLHNPCGPRPAVLPDLNAGSGASKCSQAVFVVEVLDGCGLGLTVFTLPVYKWRFGSDKCMIFLEHTYKTILCIVHMYLSIGNVLLIIGDFHECILWKWFNSIVMVTCNMVCHYSPFNCLKRIKNDNMCTVSIIICGEVHISLFYIILCFQGVYIIT